MKSQTIRQVLSVAVVTVAVAAGGHAFAQKNPTFEDLAKGAEVVTTPAQLGAAFWAMVATCSKSSSDLARRQCEGVKAARVEKVRGRTFAVAGDRAAISVGPYDAKKKGVEVKVTSCIACAKPIDVLGQPSFITGRGDADVAGGAVAGAKLMSATRTFKDLTAADKWLETVVPRLRSELLIKIPDGIAPWKKGGAAGYGVEVVGYRVFDPCDGSVIFASPDSARGPVDKKACGAAAEPEETKPVEPVKPVEPEAPKLPSSLTSAELQRSLQPARDAAQECYMTYGVAGTAKLRITYDNEGNVTAVEQTGDFVDTPSGDCVVKAVKAVKFGATTRKSTTVTFPFVLR